MATLHQATLTPSKADLVAAWLPRQDWYDGPPAPAPRPVATFRLDDPGGEVGIESMLVAVAPDDDRVWHVMMTYRAAPLADGEPHLIGVLEHSVLGTRYVYDAPGDPVARAVLSATIAEHGREAELIRVLGDGRTERVEPTMTVRGTGGGRTSPTEVTLERRPPVATDADLADGSGALIGTIGDDRPTVLARLG